MNGRTLTIALCLLTAAPLCAWAEETTAPSGVALPTLDDLATSDTMTNGWFGLGAQMADAGITVSMSLSQVYQMNLQGGVAQNSWGQEGGTHRREGRYTGSYDLELELDMDRIAGIPGATVIAHAGGGWSEGLGASSVGSMMDVNGNAPGVECRVIDLKELYWQQTLLEDRLQFRIGKLALDGGYSCRHCDVAFDTNAYANDDSGQFINSALVNNPQIPLPDEGMGATLFVEPIDGFYMAAGVGDAQADYRETGFNTAFHDEDYFFAIFETGVVLTLDAPWGKLPGGYRVGLWYDPQPKDRFITGTTKRDDAGFYLSFDQALYVEGDDDQGLGAFFRYGWADGDVNEIKCFWSTGLQYKGLIPTRDADVMGIGYANAGPGNNPALTTREQVFEVYYNAEITPWLHLTPSVQFVKDPGMGANADDATVIGMRAYIDF